MTAAALHALREQLVAALAIVDAQLAAAAVDGERLAPIAPSRATLVDTAAATKITARSSSWLYATARKHPEIGWKVASGSWVWSASALRAFMAGRASQCEESEICEVCDAPGIPQTPNQEHLSENDARNAK